MVALLLINTIDSNVIAISIGRIIDVGNSGMEGERLKVGEGEGFEVGFGFGNASATCVISG